MPAPKPGPKGCAQGGRCWRRTTGTRTSPQGALGALELGSLTGRRRGSSSGPTGLEVTAGFPGQWVGSRAAGWTGDTQVADRKSRAERTGPSWGAGQSLQPSVFSPSAPSLLHPNSSSRPPGPDLGSELIGLPPVPTCFKAWDSRSVPLHLVWRTTESSALQPLWRGGFLLEDPSS